MNDFLRIILLTPRQHLSSCDPLVWRICRPQPLLQRAGQESFLPGLICLMIVLVVSVLVSSIEGVALTRANSSHFSDILKRIHQRGPVQFGQTCIVKKQTIVWCGSDD